MKQRLLVAAIGVPLLLVVLLVLPPIATTILAAAIAGAAAGAGRGGGRRARRREKGRQSVRKTTKKAGRNGLPCDFSLNSAHQSMRTGLKSTTSAETSRYATPSLSPWNARPRPPE